MPLLIKARLQSWLTPAHTWLFARPANPQAERFGLTDLEVSLLFILFLIQVGLPMMGVQQNFWWAFLCWIAIAALSIRIIWKWESTAHRHNLTKILSSVCLFGVIAFLVYRPLGRTFYLTVKPSFILMAASDELTDCERRAFVVKHVGARVLTNPEMVFWDNNAQHGTVVKYAELSAGEPDPANPKYIWWTPPRPWDEDYTITTTSGEEKVIQHLIARSAQKQLQQATEVFVNGKKVFECRDRLLPSSYSLAIGTSTQCDSLKMPREIIDRIAKMEPEPFGVQHPDGSVTLTRLRSLASKAGIEGQPETRHVWEYQKIRLIRGLSKYPDARISVLASNSGADTWSYAQELAQVLRFAKWSVQGPRKLSDAYDGMLDIQVSADDISPPRQELTAILDAFTAAGIKHRTRGIRDPDVPRGMIVLWVGSRSPEDFNPDDCTAVTLKAPTDEGSRPCVMLAAVPHYCPFPPP